MNFAPAFRRASAAPVLAALAFLPGCAALVIDFLRNVEHEVLFLRLGQSLRHLDRIDIHRPAHPALTAPRERFIQPRQDRLQRGTIRRQQ